MTDQRDIGLRHFLGRDLQCIPPSNRREQVDAQLIYRILDHRGFNRLSTFLSLLGQRKPHVRQHLVTSLNIAFFRIFIAPHVPVLRIEFRSEEAANLGFQR